MRGLPLPAGGRRAAVAELGPSRRRLGPPARALGLVAQLLGDRRVQLGLVAPDLEAAAQPKALAPG
jgi:hypothetical protein